MTLHQNASGDVHVAENQCGTLMASASVSRQQILIDGEPSVMQATAIQTGNTGANGSGVTEECAHALACSQPEVVAFAQNTRDEVRVQGDGTISGALAAQPGMKQTTYVVALQSDGSTSINSHGNGYQEDGSAYTLNCIDRQSVVYLQDGQANGRDGHHRGEGAARGRVLASNGEEYVRALCARDFKGVGSQYVDDGKVIVQEDERDVRIQVQRGGGCSEHADV